MTVIAALCVGGRVHMAADTMATDDTGTRWPTTKLYRLPVGDEWALVGSAGRAALRPLLHRHVTIDACPAGTGDDADEWAQAIAEAVTEAAVERKITDNDGNLDGSYLFAWRNRLWEFTDHLALPITAGFAAAGCGDQVALGALHALTANGGLGWDPEAMVRLAAQAAVTWHDGCAGPVDTDATVLHPHRPPANT